MNALLESMIGLSLLAFFLWLIIKYFLRDIRRDLQEIKNDLKDLKNTERNNLQRIDHLYELCMEILKTRK